MNRYATYKDIGIPWLGDVPEHWEILSIKRLSQVKRGASPRPIDNPDYFDDDGEYAWVRIADVTASNMYLLETTQRLSDLGKSFSVPLQPNSLFLSIAGSVGKPIITKIKACIHDGFVYFPEYKHNMKFLYYIFSSGQPYLGLGKMGTQLNLNTDTVGAIKIALPSPKEQTAIAHYLDTKLGEIDALIGKQQTLLEKLAEQRTAVITHAVTKGLNPAAPIKNSGVEWLGDVPAHWDVKKFKHLCKIITGYTPSKNNDENYDENGFLWVKPDNLNDFKEISDTKEKISVVGLKSNYLIPKDSILVCSIGTIGKMGVAMQDVITNQQINSFIFNELVNKSFSKYLIYSAKGIFEHMANDNVVRILNSNTQKNIFSPLPPLVEQAAIADYLDQETAKIDRLCDTVNQTIGRLKEYRTALITQAVTGKIKVTDE
jgi:type I restriction-modification system specificity determinant